MDAPTPRCARCGDPYMPEQAGQMYCSVRCREAAKKRRARSRVRRGESLVPRGTHTTHAVADPGEDDDQDDGICAGDQHATDPWEARNAVFNEHTRLMEAVERIEASYRERARPLLAQQARNPGVRLPKLVALEQECADKIDALMKQHERAQALEHAARLAPKRVATAHEREMEHAAAREFGRDLGRGRFLHAEPEPAGRDVHQTWDFVGRADPSRLRGS